MKSFRSFAPGVARFERALIAALMAAGTFLAKAGAVTVVYDFEPPQFAAGEITPLLARAPAPGSNFLTDFGEAAVAGAFSISPFIPNTLFTGQSLIGAIEPVGPMRLSFSQPVTRLELVFGVEQSGRIELVSSLGSIVQDSRPSGGQYEGGQLVLLAPGGVLAVQLDAFTNDGRPNLWGIDNLRLEVVPEPSALLLLAGAAGVACTRRSRRSRRRRI